MNTKNVSSLDSTTLKYGAIGLGLLFLASFFALPPAPAPQTAGLQADAPGATGARS